MVEVAELSLCKKLSVLCPDAKTEYYWGYYEDEGEIVAISQREIILNGSQYFHIICPAWQIHELLPSFTKSISQTDRDGWDECYEFVIRYDEGKKVWFCGYFCLDWDKVEWCWYKDFVSSGVRFVDALIKLAIWRKENE